MYDSMVSGFSKLISSLLHTLQGNSPHTVCVILNTRCSPQRTDLASDYVISKMMLKSSDDRKAFQHVLHHGFLICRQGRDRGSVLIWLGEMTTLAASLSAVANWANTSSSWLFNVSSCLVLKWELCVNVHLGYALKLHTWYWLDRLRPKSSMFPSKMSESSPHLTLSLWAEIW